MENPMLVLPDVHEPAGLNAFPILYWNHAGLQLNRITHSLGGPQTGPTMSSRALGLLHLAMHDAFFGVLEGGVGPTMWLDPVNRPALAPEITPTEVNANAALTCAAITILDRLYGAPGAISDEARDTLLAALRDLKSPSGVGADLTSPAHHYGADVAEKVHSALAVLPGDPGAGQDGYQPVGGRYHFDDEPQNPVRLVDKDPNDPSKGKKAVQIYHGPYYGGGTVKSFAVTDPAGHRIADWPGKAGPGSPGYVEYLAALKEVHAVGGAAGLASTTRTADQTVAAYFWAYDGANLIGTPPRLYNQILREIAWAKRNNAASTLDQSKEFVRLFALANTAMADAGKFAWAEKYRHDLWRPLSGIRQHDESAFAVDVGSAAVAAPADPFWLALGAPETNSNKLSFKPPFPAYPSGHATFGAACFQMARLFYHSIGKAAVADPNGPDDISFSFVSEEMNGISRDLHQPHDPSSPIQDQPGLVRTYVKRNFSSLWRAIWENAFSRIWLGVHWRFDAFDYADAGDGAGGYKDPAEVTYRNVWAASRDGTVTDGSNLPIGGVPLGLGIANDIFWSGMKQQGGALTGARAEPVQSQISKTTMTQ
jgi:vanadium chloroperoxidase